MDDEFTLFDLAGYAISQILGAIVGAATLEVYTHCMHQRASLAILHACTQGLLACTQGMLLPLSR